MGSKKRLVSLRSISISRRMLLHSRVRRVLRLWKSRSASHNRSLCINSLSRSHSRFRSISLCNLFSSRSQNLSLSRLSLHRLLIQNRL
ncbi:hypothetical protein D3C72_2294120 [compost metagenome]